MYKSQKQIDPHDWFCGPGSHIKVAYQYSMDYYKGHLKSNT